MLNFALEILKHLLFLHSLVSLSTAHVPGLPVFILLQARYSSDSAFVFCCCGFSRDWFSEMGTVAYIRRRDSGRSTAIVRSKKCLLSPSLSLRFSFRCLSTY